MTDKIKTELKANQILKLIEHLDYDLQLAILKNAKERLTNNIEVSDFEVVKKENDFVVKK